MDDHKDKISEKPGTPPDAHPRYALFHTPDKPAMYDTTGELDSAVHDLTLNNPDSSAVPLPRQAGDAYPVLVGQGPELRASGLAWHAVTGDIRDLSQQFQDFKLQQAVDKAAESALRTHERRLQVRQERDVINYCVLEHLNQSLWPKKRPAPRTTPNNAHPMKSNVESQFAGGPVLSPSIQAECTLSDLQNLLAGIDVGSRHDRCHMIRKPERLFFKVLQLEEADHAPDISDGHSASLTRWFLVSLGNTQARQHVTNIEASADYPSFPPSQLTRYAAYL